MQLPLYVNPTGTHFNDIEMLMQSVTLGLEVVSLSELANLGVLAPIDVVHKSILILVYKTLGRCYDD
jgi:hypothetical protein